MYTKTKVTFEDDREGEGAYVKLGTGMPIMVLKDRRPKTIEARVAPTKGKHPYAIRRMPQDLKNFGYKRIILKSDQEPAIKELTEHVKRER